MEKITAAVEHFYEKCGCSCMRYTISKGDFLPAIVVVDRIGAGGKEYCPLGHDTLGAKIVGRSKRPH